MEDRSPSVERGADPGSIVANSGVLGKHPPDSEFWFVFSTGPQSQRESAHLIMPCCQFVLTSGTRSY